MTKEEKDELLKLCDKLRNGTEMTKEEKDKLLKLLDGYIKK